MSNGPYETYTDSGRQKTGFDALEWACRVAELGAGEIIVTSIDREGTGCGYDLELTRMIADTLSIPVIACGGAGKAEHVYDVINIGKADAVCMASIFHYDVLRNRSSNAGDSWLVNNYDPSQKGVSELESLDLPGLKRFLDERGINVRLD